MGRRALGRWGMPCSSRGERGGAPSPRSASSPPIEEEESSHQPTCLPPKLTTSRALGLDLTGSKDILYPRGLVHPVGRAGPSRGLSPINAQRAPPGWACAVCFSLGPTGTPTGLPWGHRPSRGREGGTRGCPGVWLGDSGRAFHDTCAWGLGPLIPPPTTFLCRHRVVVFVF